MQNLWRRAARFSLVSCALLITASLAGAQAQQAEPSEAQGPAGSEAPDPQRVLSKMHHLNQMQIQLAEMAGEKLEEGELQRYAGRLHRDHSVADEKVASLASELGIDLQTMEPAPEQQQMREQLTAATGDEFATAYVEAMRKTHAQAIETMTQAEASGAPEELVALIEKLKPILGQHVQLAEHLQQGPQVASAADEDSR